MAELFPESAYRLTHNALFPHDCIHVENLGGDIGRKELLNKRITLGVFPWKFKGGEAAFSVGGVGLISNLRLLRFLDSERIRKLRCE